MDAVVQAGSGNDTAGGSQVDYPCQQHSCSEKNGRPDTAVLHHIAERTVSWVQPVETVVIQVTDLITSMPE